MGSQICRYTIHPAATHQHGYFSPFLPFPNFFYPIIAAPGILEKISFYSGFIPASPDFPK
jgi:hypothetical protein